jgi:antirestriction protein
MLCTPQQKKGEGEMTYRIYVASLSDYNAGILHGSWIDLDGKDADDLQDEVNAILKDSPYAEQYGEEAEEWAIHDYELGGIRISESEGFEQVVKIAEALEEHGEVLAIYVNDIGDFDEAVETFEDAYLGEYDSFLDFATNLFDELYGDCVDERIRFYIDYEAFSRDLEAQGYTYESGHVFRPV